MEIRIDAKAQALYIKLNPGKVSKTENHNDYSVDFNKDGKLMGFEIPKLSQEAVTGDGHFAELRDLVTKAIQSKDENVRDAAVQVGDWLSEAIRKRRAVEEYKEYVGAIELLIDYYDDGTEENARYIDEMKSSPQRSLEVLLDRVTHGGYELEITHVPPPAILARREELETKIAELLEEAKSDFCFHDVLEQIYRETGIEDLEVVIAMFEGDGATAGAPLTNRLDDVVDLVNEAWNYFPHASLGGLCPAEQNKKAVG